jgi:hypothetical protein
MYIILPHSGSLGAWEPETVNRKGLQVKKSLEASLALRKLEVGGFERAVLSFMQECSETKDRFGGFATL